MTTPHILICTRCHRALHDVGGEPIVLARPTTRFLGGGKVVFHRDLCDETEVKRIDLTTILAEQDRLPKKALNDSWDKEEENNDV